MGLAAQCNRPFKARSMPIRGATQTDNKSEELKNRVRTHWEQETAGTRYADENEDAAYYAAIEKSRYELEPFILELAGFEQAAGERVLEIGVGAGTDFSQFVRHGARAVGVDLTMAAVQHTARHLKALNISSGNHDLL
ncbi:MAG: hypothetical protein FJ317_09205, partial [SAR202 cluster bacterium]|nr:hypothetical protein [SAR202 cluster bacterium]